MTDLTLLVPTQQLADDIRGLLDPSIEADIAVWDGAEAPPRDRVDLVVPPYLKQGRALRALADVRPRLVQGQSIGFDGVDQVLPEGLVYANASSVHETATAELAIGLMLVAQRGLADAVRNQDRGEWQPAWTDGLADRRVVLLGYGGVGQAIAARLSGFEADLVPVASRARDEDGVHVHGIDELGGLLAGADILVNALPGGPATRHIVGDAALAALPDGALVVNVGRGTSVDTDALVEHVRRGRIRVASDVFDPEPLPAGHPLWTLDGVFITPHTGGLSSAMRPRVAKLVAEQAARLARGEDPINVVIGG
ncbi:2-hydroxyacid dehydrogenase [Microbacterium karelineae]|uniref:2-hydroxyacid dehydrogenase n=1 Tax=Microbacterium karelineae TaxID=2654283 RepID=UPI0012EA647B|nr:2-hydroxyacid dehydrogenase [Microbacterium karelineae]